MYKEENLVLIRYNDSPPAYYIMDKESRTWLVEDSEEQKKIVEKLILEGVEIFDNIKLYYNKYPLKSVEERKNLAKENLRQLLKQASENKDKWK